MMQEYITYPGSDRKYKARRIKCENCGEMFLRRETGAPSSQRSFCSRSCREAYFDTGVELECATCGKSFRRTASKINCSKHKVHFCSRECKDYGQSLEGGIEKIQPDHYSKDGDCSIHTYRKYGLKDGDYSCQICGYNEHEEGLQVHHKDKDRSNNNRGNLVVLCGTCHLLVHRGIKQI